MKKFFAILGILLLLFVGSIWFFYFRGRHRRPSGPKPIPLAVSKHSAAFNYSVQPVLASYFSLVSDFALADTAKIALSVTQLKGALDSFKIDELRKDTVIYETALEPYANCKSQVAALAAAPNLAAKRSDFNVLSNNLRDLLVTIRYDQSKLYWQECAVAFNGQTTGNWLSKTIESANPYITVAEAGDNEDLQHCAVARDTLNFLLPDSTKH